MGKRPSVSEISPFDYKPKERRFVRPRSRTILCQHDGWSHTTLTCMEAFAKKDRGLKEEGFKMKVLPKKEWATTVDYDCGREVQTFDQKETWVVTNFCKEHDPTIDR